ncbi:unnamed protein product, partial [marine sediment metagenome]
MEFPGMSNPSKLSDDDVNRIAEAIVEKAREGVGIRDVIIGSAMGKGAIPLYGRETRKEPCSCCLIDPEGPNAPENRMCTTKGAIGTLKDSEERNWCSEIKIVSDGRCARARAISEAARVCKEKHPYDTEAFFRCYIPAFSQATRGSNPDTGTSIIDLRGDYDEIAHVREGILYRKGNIVQVWWDKWGKETWTAPGEEQAKENFNA